jgi:hypothetical protein
VESETDKGRAQPAGPVRRTVRTLLPSCRDASRLQSEALDRPLTGWQRFGLVLHLAVCKWCRRYGRQLRFLRHAAHEHPEQLDDATPHSLSAEARERLKASLRSGDK